jgi:hypothetical protein
MQLLGWNQLVDAADTTNTGSAAAEIRTAVSTRVSELYGHLCSAQQLDPAGLPAVSELLDGKAWVWAGGGTLPSPFLFFTDETVAGCGPEAVCCYRMFQRHFQSSSAGLSFTTVFGLGPPPT